MTVSVEESPAPAVAAPAPTPDVVTASPDQVAATTKIVSDARTGMEIATFDELFGKPKRRLEFTVTAGKDGQVVTRRMVFLALNGDEYDSLTAAHPPTPKQKSENHTWNPDTFPPALISAVSQQPKLSVEQAAALWKHKDWSAGEQATLFSRALEVCQSGLSVPFSVTD